MNMKWAWTFLPLLLAGACTTPGEKPLAPKPLPPLAERPLYQFTPGELNIWLGDLQAEEKNLRNRVMHIARKNIGQPYELYLLGEFPTETIDPQPLFCLEKSDCVTFVEHTYAMALAQDWRSFFVTLQRIRYRNGEIGYTSRNHYTIPDWEPANSWLVVDQSAKLVGAKKAWITARTNRQKFFAKQGIKGKFTDLTVRVPYVPLAALDHALPGLSPGDMVQVIKGRDQAGWCGHVGLVGRLTDGTATFIHSHKPKVGEILLAEYAKKLTLANLKKKPAQAKFLGFRFLQLRQDPLATLRAREGKDAPRITSKEKITHPAVQEAR